MATKLKDLRVNRIALVDKGANPGAWITLFKRDDTVAKDTKKKPMPPENDGDADDDEKGKDMEKRDEMTIELPDEIQKRLDAAVALEKRAQELEQRVAKMEEQRERTEAIQKARTLDRLGKADDLASLIQKARKLFTADEYAAFEKNLAGWNEQLAKGKLFAEFGSDAQEATDPYGKLEAAAKALVSKGDGKMTFEQAFAKVCDTPEGKELYRAYLAGGDK